MQIKQSPVYFPLFCQFFSTSSHTLNSINTLIAYFSSHLSSPISHLPSLPPFSPSLLLLVTHSLTHSLPFPLSPHLCALCAFFAFSVVKNLQTKIITTQLLNLSTHQLLKSSFDIRWSIFFLLSLPLLVTYTLPLSPHLCALRAFFVNSKTNPNIF